MDKYQNKYRIQSARWQNWDYGWNGAYFITICTANRECFFGDIVDGEMELSEIGTLADKFLLEIPQRYEYAILDEFVVMPNHVHAIVIIDKTDDGRGGGDVGFGNAIRRDAINRVSTNRVPTEPEPKPKSPTNKNTPGKSKKRGGITGIKNPMLHQNISRIFNWYTGRVTFESRKINENFAWQPRFHDHVIRDIVEYYRIKNYIMNNPKNWNDDTLNNQ